MTTSEVLTEQALSRRSSLARSVAQAEDPTTTQAVELLDAVLTRLPV